MGIKSDALKVLALSKAQKSALEAAVKAEKISVPSLNMARMSYGGIEPKVQ